MAVNEDILAGFHAALQSPEPLLRMRHLVCSELEHGVSRTEVLGQLESPRIELRGSGRGEEESVVLDVMDFVSGWASPPRATQTPRLGSTFGAPDEPHRGSNVVPI